MYPANRRRLNIQGTVNSAVKKGKSKQANPFKNQSTLSDAQLRKMRSKGGKSSYKVPKTPRKSGIGWGP